VDFDEMLEHFNGYYRAGQMVVQISCEIVVPHCALSFVLPRSFSRISLGVRHRNLLESVSGDFNYFYRVTIHDGSTLALFQSTGIFNIVAERDDTNEEAFEQVEKATDSEPVKGEELLESEDVKRKLRDAKERLKAESGNPGGE
jgi:hypothetical protein